jgi:hypothetical protein
MPGLFLSAVTNPFTVGTDGHDIFTATELFYAVKDRTWWQKNGLAVVFGIIGVIASAAAFIVGGPAAAGVVATTIIKNFAIGVAVSLVIGAALVGAMCAATGSKFWKAYGDFVQNNFLDILATSFAFAGIAGLQYAVAARAALANAAKTVTLDPSDIRFSQSSVNTPKAQAIIDDMGVNGWKGDPIDVVRMPDGMFTSIDNKRLLASKITNTPVHARVHAFDSAIDPARAVALVNKSGVLPTTWGKGVLNRIGRQAYWFRNAYSYGSFSIGFGGV